MKKRKIAGIIAAAVLLAVMRSDAAQVLYNTRGGVTLYCGESCAAFNNGTAFYSEGDAGYQLDIGVCQINIPVQVKCPQSVVPGGQCIGVALYTDGIIIVGCQDIAVKDGSRVNPARSAGLRAGDIIKQVNGKDVRNITEFVLQSEKYKQEAMELTVLRDGESFRTKINAAYDINDDKYRLGLWLKDSTAGIGTLTCYDPETMRFAALGHAICESETGVLMPLARGEIVDCVISEIQKGRKGQPGELKGSFRADAECLGNISTNCEYGLYGTLVRLPGESIYGELPVGSRASVHTGEATVLASIDNCIKEYSIKIVTVNRQEKRSQKGIVLQVTDRELLEKTGGIVQGMSGSPIIQDGKIVGAVTHVLVNDPTRGYGIYIENMLEETA